MRKALFVSAVLHATVLTWALVDLPFARKLDAPESTPLPVDIVTPEEFTKIVAGRRDGKDAQPAAAKPAEKPAETRKEEPRRQETRTAAAPPPPPPPPAPAPKPAEAAEASPAPTVTKPEPAPAPETAPAKVASTPPPPRPKPAPPRPRAARAAPETPRPAAAREQPRPRSEFNPDRIAALLNKVPDAGPSGAPAPEPEAPETPARGMASGRDMTMSMSDLDALRARISQCWIPPVGGMGAERIRVRLRLRLNPDGSLTRPPEVVDAENSAFFQVAADSALRAVWQCQPYQLPPAKYALWRDMILNFDPREMFGG